MAKDNRLIDFAQKAGISIGYASNLLSDDVAKKREPSLAMACQIFSRTGVKLGILKEATDREAKIVVSLAERAGLLT